MPRTSKQKVIAGALEDIAEVDRETALVLFRSLDGYLVADEDPDDAETERLRRKAGEAYQVLYALINPGQMPFLVTDLDLQPTMLYDDDHSGWD
jgi:hypothetical protein